MFLLKSSTNATSIKKPPYLNIQPSKSGVMIKHHSIKKASKTSAKASKAKPEEKKAEPTVQEKKEEKLIQIHRGEDEEVQESVYTKYFFMMIPIAIIIVLLFRFIMNKIMAISIIIIILICFSLLTRIMKND